MTAWLTEDDLQEEFNSYLKSEYGDSDGDFSIENSYLNVIDIVTDTGHYDDMFDDWKQNQLDNDNLFEHPNQAMWTRNTDLAEYADEHPDVEEVTEWDSIDEATDEEPLEYDVGDDLYITMPGHSWYGKVGTVTDTDSDGRDSGAYYMEVKADGVDDHQWFKVEYVSPHAPTPVAEAPAVPAPPAPAVAATTSEYPGPDDPYPLDVNRLPFKVGDPVLSINHGVVGTGTTGKVESIDERDRNYTYFVRWENGDGHYARRADLRPNPGGEEREAAAKAAILAAKLDRTREYLSNRTGASDEGWQESINTCVNAFQPDGVTREMVQTIADALRPPKSHAATITL